MQEVVSPTTSHTRDRAEAFCRQYGLRLTILLAPMAGRMPSQPLRCDRKAQRVDPGPSAWKRSRVGVFPPGFVGRLKDRGIAWFATATTLAEAEIARDAGADAIIVQGYEAGGHRGAFDEAAAERQLVGLFALIAAREEPQRRV